MKKEQYSKILQNLINNKSVITGIRINSIYYTVNCVLIDEQENYDEFSNDDIILNCYQLDDNNCYIEYEFSVSDIKNAKEVMLYKEVEL